MSHGNKITKTYIIDESLDSSVFIVSACTAVHTNALYSCSGDTSIFLTSGSTVFNGDIDVNGNISGNTFYGDGSQLNNVNNFYVTGGTYDNGNSEIILTRNDGGNVVIDLSTLDLNDTVITGGTFNNSNQEITFTNNDGGSFTIDLSSLDINDTFVTGSTFNSSNDTLTLSRNDGTNINEIINNFNDLIANSMSATTISATTFYGDGSNLTGLKATFSGLTDTNLSGVTDGQIAIYDSSNNEWIPGNVETTFSGLTDTSFSGLTNGQLAIYNTNTNKWENTQLDDSQFINAYDSDMDGTSIPGSGIDVTIDTEQFNNALSRYTLSDPYIEISKSGVYKIDYKLNTRGGGRATSYGDLFVDTGSGFNIIAGSRVFCYNRLVGHGYNTGSGSIVMELKQGDRIKLRAFQNTGSGSLMANESSITVSNHRGPAGPAGPKGDTGSISGTVFNGHFQMDGVDLGNVSGSVDVDLDQGNVFYMTLTGDTTFGYVNDNKSANYIFVIEQDGSGGHNFNFVSNKFQSPGGNAPDISKTVNAKTLLTGTYDEVNNKMMVFGAKEMNDI